MPHIDFAGAVKKATGMPTFHGSRIPDVATARHAIASGQLDIVGMTRAHIADPHIVRKIAEGMGAVGITVKTASEIAPALQEAQRLNAEGKTVLIDVHTNIEDRRSKF